MIAPQLRSLALLPRDDAQAASIRRERLRKSQLQSTRRGSLTLLLVISLAVLLGLVGLAWNVASLTYAHHQLQTACEAAALAGAAQLVAPPPGGDDSIRLFRARQAAVHVASWNYVGNRAVQVIDNPANTPGGDLLVGMMNEPSHHASAFHPWTGVGDMNTLIVRAQRSQLRGNPVAMRLGQMLGVLDADVSSYARATIDRRVYGFRPMVGAAAPIVPLVIDQATWENATGTQTPSDQFAVDHGRGMVTSGSDGIMEIQLRAWLDSSSAGVGTGSSTPSLARLMLTADSLSLNTWQRQLTLGLGENDLTSWQGAIIVPTSGLPAQVESTMSAACIDALWDICGQARAWPLGACGAASGDGAVSSALLTGWAAATVVDIRVLAQAQPPQVVVTLQPAPLATSTALAGPGYLPNPWLAKLMLTQ